MKLRLNKADEQYFEMEYADNGEAMVQPFEEVVKKGFGLRLASRLSRQLQGSFGYRFDQLNRFTITFASKAAREHLADG